MIFLTLLNTFNKNVYWNETKSTENLIGEKFNKMKENKIYSTMEEMDFGLLLKHFIPFYTCTKVAEGG